MKPENRFIAELEQKAKEQQKLVDTQIIPGWARGLGNWLAVNPWRLVIPVAGIVYGVLRIVYGEQFRELILGLFGGFAR